MRTKHHKFKWVVLAVFLIFVLILAVYLIYSYLQTLRVVPVSTDLTSGRSPMAVTTLPQHVSPDVSSSGETTDNNTQNSSNNILLNCQDCWLAPVNKIYQLSSSYVPNVVNTGLSGGGKMTSPAVAALKELFSAAANSGIKISIISAYRSYSEQVTTFNYWKQQQKNANPNLSDAAAEVAANVVSAKPGHSEHQLGTTVDLKCSSCSSFDNSSGNLTLYKFLEEHAYEYGFAISYPNGTQQYTGYKYEPWHIRFIGKELAQEFFKTNYLSNNGMYLAKFLLSKGLN